jgi:hypothetical protein
MKQAGAVVILALAALVLTGQAGSGKVVEAERFLVRDPTGTIRAELGFMAADGSVELHLADKGGKHRVSLHVNPDGSAGLGAIDKDGKTVRITLGLTPAGLPKRASINNIDNSTLVGVG